MQEIDTTAQQNLRLLITKIQLTQSNNKHFPCHKYNTPYDKKKFILYKSKTPRFYLGVPMKKNNEKQPKELRCLQI